jgi:hypothetical protein
MFFNSVKPSVRNFKKPERVIQVPRVGPVLVAAALVVVDVVAEFELLAQPATVTPLTPMMTADTMLNERRMLYPIHMRANNREEHSATNLKET